MTAALRSLFRRPRRTALTLGGIAVGACTYMLLIGSAQGFLSQFRKLTMLFGADLIVQQGGATSPWNSVLPVDQVPRVRQLVDVKRISSLALGKARIVGAPFFLVFGFDPAETLMNQMSIVRGRVLRPGADEMMLGVLAEAHLRSGGDEIDVRGRRMRVVGVYRTGHRVLDAGGVLDLATTQTLFNLRGAVSLLFLELPNPATAQAAADLIRSTLPNVEASSARDWIDGYGQLVVVEDFARFLAMLALLISGLGVSNVMHISIGERTQELAVLRAIGWSRPRIGAQIAAECMVLTLLGAAAAVPMAELVLYLIDSARVGSMEFAGFLPPHLSFRVIVEGLAVSSLAGLLGALVPLLRAIRVKPAEALRLA